MGGAFGLFMSSFEYAGPMMNEDLVKQTTKQQQMNLKRLSLIIKYYQIYYSL